MSRSVLVAGAGVFGATAALELARRGHRVSVCDPGLAAAVPRPDQLPSLAESTDISKVVRLDYGADERYVEAMERALDGWRRWQRGWDEAGLDRVFHEVGVLFLSRDPLGPTGFEADNLRVLSRRGHPVERLDARALRARFPAWNADRYPEGYHHAQGGYAESGRVVARLLAEAHDLGVTVLPGVGLAEVEGEARVTGARLSDGRRLAVDVVVVATGSWTGHLLPERAADLTSTGQPVFHLRPADPSLFRPERFPVFGADISRTGWYGFPVGRDGVVKIANHGVGRRMHPESVERATTADEEARLRAFLAETFPALADAPVVHRRVCVYGDSRDEHFWITPDPGRPGLVIAAGGSGHGFKFAPLLGAWIADAVEGAPNPDLDRFGWRPDRRDAVGEEAARAR